MISTLFGIPVKVSRPEDTILMKLRWAAISGGSEKQFGDAIRVYELQYGRIDDRYMDQWAARLNVVSMLNRIRAEARFLHE